jgi:hypothetical protein
MQYPGYNMEIAQQNYWSWLWFSIFFNFSIHPLLSLILIQNNQKEIVKSFKIRGLNIMMAMIE